MLVVEDFLLFFAFFAFFVVVVVEVDVFCAKAATPLSSDRPSMRVMNFFIACKFSVSNSLCD